jgi:phospholipid/cholesterol/gamma-HCH transport system permease protein
MTIFHDVRRARRLPERLSCVMAVGLVAEPGQSKEPSFRVQRVETGPRHAQLHIEGELGMADAAQLWNEVRGCIGRTRRRNTLNFDVARLTAIDGASMALLVHLRGQLQRRKRSCEFIGASGQVQQMIHLYGGDVPAKRRTRQRPISMIEQLGSATMDVLRELQLVLAFFGQLIVAGAQGVRAPRTINWRDVPHTIERSGADAVPIVIIINFLVGFVMAFQGAVQLKQFGANIYVADLVGLSVSRELGPLMTAIIVCGRSGAAFAAELGTMKVSEEVDALRTLGFNPLGYLVMPRMLALIVVMPLLTLVADLMGVLGGLTVGITSLDLTMQAYLIQTQGAVRAWDVFSGVLKSAVFGLAIGVISCQQGLATSGGAEGVGRRTTASVVAILFALIAIDAVFTVFFQFFGV